MFLILFKIGILTVWKGLDSYPDPNWDKFQDPDPNTMHLHPQYCSKPKSGLFHKRNIFQASTLQDIFCFTLEYLRKNSCNIKIVEIRQ